MAFPPARMRSLSVPKLELRRLSKNSISGIDPMGPDNWLHSQHCFYLGDIACDLIQLFYLFDFFRSEGDSVPPSELNGSGPPHESPVKGQTEDLVERIVPLANINEALERPGLGLEPTPINSPPEEPPVGQITPSPTPPGSRMILQDEENPTYTVEQPIHQTDSIDPSIGAEETKVSDLEGTDGWDKGLAEIMDDVKPAGGEELETELSATGLGEYRKMSKDIDEGILDHGATELSPGATYHISSHENLKVVSESVKILLVFLGIGWEENVIPLENTVDPSENGKVPMLKLSEDEEVEGIFSICTFLAREHGLQMDDSYDQERVDMVGKQWAEWLETIRQDLLERRFIRDWSSIRVEKVQPFLDSIQGILQENDTQWICNAKMSWVDLVIGDFLGLLVEEVDKGVLSDFPALKRLSASVAEIVPIRDYRFKHKSDQFF